MVGFVAHHLRRLPAAAHVVLLHGVFADHHLWDGVARLLGGMDVLALDSPGHGAATRSVPLPSMDGQVAELARLLEDQFGEPPWTRPVVLAGHSWGGMLLLRLALARPELVPRLLLTNTPLQRNRGWTRAGFLAQRAAVAAGVPPRQYGRVAASSLYGRAHRLAHPGVVDAMGSTVAALGRRGLLEVVDRVLLEPDDVIGLLPRIEVPMVLVAGRDDYVGSPQMRQAVADNGHRLHEHPGGHMGPAEAPEEIARLLRSLTAGVASPAASG